MMAAKTIFVTGDKEVDRKLAALEPTVQRKVGRKALRQAVKAIVLPKAKADAPIDTGALESSLTVRAMPRSRKARIGYVVQTRDGAFKGAQFYGGFQELGTKYMEADPFLRPALYSSEGEIRDVLLGALRNELRLMAVRR